MTEQQTLEALGLWMIGDLMPPLTAAQFRAALALAGGDPARITPAIEARVTATAPRTQAKGPLVQPGAVQARPCTLPASGSWVAISGWLEPLVRHWPRPDVTGTDLDSSTEQRFIVERLDRWLATGEILAWAHEPLELRVGVGTPALSRLTPDFVVLLPDGRLVCREVKGGFTRPRDRSRMKAICVGMPDLALEVWSWKKGWTCERLSG